MSQGRTRDWVGVVALGFTLAACGDTTGPRNRDAILYPPAPASMELDLSFFTENEPGAGTATGWQLALTAAADAEADVVTVVGVPAALYRAALDVQPVFDDGIWLRQFTESVDGVEYSGTLRGRVNGMLDDWTMVVTAAGHTPPLLNYAWFLGISTSVGGPFASSGGWTFFDAATASAQPVANVNFSGTNGFDYQSNTGAWRYREDGTGRTLERFASDDEPPLVLVWNVQTHVGRITVDNGTPVCWGADLLDTPCP